MTGFEATANFSVSASERKRERGVGVILIFFDKIIHVLVAVTEGRE